MVVGRLHARLGHDDASAGLRCPYCVRNTEVWVHWKDHLAIGSVDDVNILFSGDLTHQGRWTISSHHLGLPYTGLDALMRHFGAHPEDRPLLSSPEGVTLVARILKDARARLTEGAEEGAD